MSDRQNKLDAKVAAHSDRLERVLKDRGNAYGPFKAQARVSQELKTIYRQSLRKNQRFIAMEESDQLMLLESLELICMKLSRIATGDPLLEDNWTDIAGYAQLIIKNTGEQK